MKGLNIKRIAAIGIGAALVGSALAPAVMAGAFTNLDKLQKTDVISATGAPVVDIVVGTIGQPADVIWAGNIAAKVAQMAVVPAGGATGKTVDLTVGATSSVAGQGRELDRYFGDSSLTSMTAGISDVPTFSTGSVKIKYPSLNGGSYTDIAVDENAKVVPAFSLQTDADKNLAGQIVAEVNSGGVIYTQSYGEGIPFSPNTNETGLDSNANVDLQVPFMGKTYTVSEIHSTSASNVTDIVLFSSTTPTTLNVGESVQMDGAGTYAGKTLTAVLANIYVTGTGNQSYNATWNLMDGTTVIKSVNIASGGSYDLKDQFGSSYVNSSVYVTNVAQDVVANKYYASIRTGTNRFEIKNNDVFPYSSSVNAVNKLWNASITAVGGRITAIQVINNRAEWLKSDMTTLNASQGRFGPVGMGGSFAIPGIDYLKYEFVGMESKPMYRAVIGNEQLIVADTKGIERTIPFIIQLNKGQNNITVGGKDVTVDVNETANTVRVWNRSVNDVTTVYDANDSGSFLRDGNIDVSQHVDFAVSTDWKNSNSGVVRYVMAANKTTHKYYLLLAAQKFDMYGTDDSISGASSELNFRGTEDYTDTSPSFAFYVPDKQTYDFLDTNLGLTATNHTLTEGDNYVKTAVFTFNEGTGVVSSVSDVNAYVDTSIGSLVNTQDNKSKAVSNEVTSGYGASAIINENTTAASSRLLGFGTAYGSTLSASSQVLTIMKPSEPRKVQEFLGTNSNVVTPTGGTPYTGVAVGQTVGNVTVTSISGATSGSTIVPVGNIVVPDTQSASGKSILVGGWLANTKVAADLQVDGQPLNSRLVASGDYVSAVLSDGSILVAGWTAADTASAAQALITALDGLQ